MAVVRVRVGRMGGASDVYYEGKKIIITTATVVIVRYGTVAFNCTTFPVACPTLNHHFAQAVFYTFAFGGCAARTGALIDIFDSYEIKPVPSVVPSVCTSNPIDGFAFET